MSQDAFARKVELMLAAINAHAKQCARATGRKTLSQAVMTAMAHTPRHLFVPDEFVAFAYEDRPLSIGAGKTISQPFMVALACELLDLKPQARVLEVGAGLGYQAAVLSALCDHVYAVEIIPELAEEAMARLDAAGCDNVDIRIGDGARGWPEHAPYDGIVVSSAAKRLPKPLLEQLKPGARMVIPLGDDDAQMLQLIIKDENGDIRQKALIPVRYSALSIAH